MTDEVHIASFIVHAAPTTLARVRAQLLALPQLECPLSDDEKSKLIALLEVGSSLELEQRVAHIRTIPGVLSVTMVYHQVEPLAQLQQELVAWA